MIGRPAISADGRRFVIAHREGAEDISQLDACDASGACRTLVPDGGPDRVAISDDGVTVAFVASWTGLPSVHVVPFAGGDPVQLTNVGVVLTPGQEPPGFVPPPHDGALAIVGDSVVWDAPDGPHRAELP